MENNNVGKMKTFFLPVIAFITISCQPQNFDKAIHRTAINNDFSGAILLAINDSIIFDKTFGYSDKKREVENMSNTIFPVASITKLFIKQAILCLVDSQKLSLNDTLAKYWNYIKFADSLTISDLLYHKSGLPDIHNRIPRFNHPDELKDTISVMELFDLINSFPQLEFKPGSQISYSNSNYLILAHLIEKLTQTSLDAYLRETIFQPYAMIQSGLYDYYSTECGHTAGFYVRGNTTSYVQDFNFRNFWGTGNAYSTTHDLFRYYKCSQKYLKPEISTQLVQHSGYYVGFRSYYKVIPEIGMAIIILSNNGSFNVDIVIDQFLKFVKGEYLEKKYPNHSSDSLTGHYFTSRNGNVWAIEVTITNEELRVNNIKLFPIAEKQFLMDNNSLTLVSFNANNNNEVKMTMNDNGEILVFSKQ